MNGSCKHIYVFCYWSTCLKEVHEIYTDTDTEGHNATMTDSNVKLPSGQTSHLVNSGTEAKILSSFKIFQDHLLTVLPSWSTKLWGFDSISDLNQNVLGRREHDLESSLSSSATFRQGNRVIKIHKVDSISISAISVFQYEQYPVCNQDTCD